MFRIDHHTKTSHFTNGITTIGRVKGRNIKYISTLAMVFLGGLFVLVGVGYTAPLSANKTKAQQAPPPVLDDLTLVHLWNKMNGSLDTMSTELAHPWYRNQNEFSKRDMLNKARRSALNSNLFVVTRTSSLGEYDFLNHTFETGFSSGPTILVNAELNFPYEEISPKDADLFKQKREEVGIMSLEYVFVASIPDELILLHVSEKEARTIADYGREIQADFVVEAIKANPAVPDLETWGAKRTIEGKIISADVYTPELKDSFSKKILRPRKILFRWKTKT